MSRPFFCPGFVYTRGLLRRGDPMRAVFLDYATLNPADLDLTRLHQGFSELVLHDMTGPDDIFARTAGFDVVIVKFRYMDCLKYCRSSI